MAGTQEGQVSKCAVGPPWLVNILSCLARVEWATEGQEVEHALVLCWNGAEVLSRRRRCQGEKVNPMRPSMVGEGPFFPWGWLQWSGLMCWLRNGDVQMNSLAKEQRSVEMEEKGQKSTPGGVVQVVDDPPVILFAGGLFAICPLTQRHYPTSTIVTTSNKTRAISLWWDLNQFVLILASRKQ